MQPVWYVPFLEKIEETTLLQERTDTPLFMLPSASRNALGKSSFLPYLRFVIARRLLMIYIYTIDCPRGWSCQGSRARLLFDVMFVCRLLLHTCGRVHMHECS
jgi:hypothetical protein